MTALRLSALSLAAALAAALAATAQTGGVVQGRVISSLRGEPVADALVTMRELQTAGGAAPQVYICQTGADGKFSIAGVAPGVYDPRPSKLGFETRPPGRFATAHDFPPVTVDAGKAVTGLEIRLYPDSTIAGKVLDSEGDPVRYAQVEAQQYVYAAGKKQLQTVRAAQTDDHGEYRMFYLPPGRYYLRATSTDRSFPGSRQMNGRAMVPSMMMSAAYYPGVTEAARAAELQALPGGELDGIDIHLRPEKRYSIRGKLPASDGANEGHGIRVVERTDGARPPQYSVMLTGNSYEIRDIAPGSYLVIAQINRAKPEERLYAQQQVEVIDRDVDDVDLSYSPGIQIKGTVKTEGSAPLDLEKLQLLLWAGDSFGQQMAKPAADGRFTSPQLASGTYQVRIAGRNAYVNSVYLGDRKLPDNKIDAEHLSGDVTVFVSADFGHVEGTVTDDAGKPAYNADVTLIPDQSRADWQQRFYSVFTSPDGKFNFSNVQPGEYKAYAWLGVEPGAPQSAEFRKPHEGLGVAIKVEADGRSRVDLKAIVLEQ